MLSLVMSIYVPPGGESVVHRCLDSIEQNTSGVSRFDHQYVIWQGPINETPEMEQLCIRLLQWASDFRMFTQPLGFTVAFNKGLKFSQGDVVQLNSDTVVPAGWLDRLVADQDRTGGVMCCDDNILRAGPGIHPDTAWGSCFYLPRAVIDKAGLWDEALNYRYSDQDYWIRCKKAGFKVSVTGNVKLHHENSYTLRHQAKEPRVHRQIQRERREMKRRHGVLMFTKWAKKQTTEG